MRDKQKSKDLLQAFRESRKQITKPVESVNVRKRGNFTQGYTKPPHRNVSSDPYSSFLKKYENLADTVDSFKTQDLMYFFREKARENGVKYVIANMKRDMGIFKKLQENYTPREICLMIEFIFSSGQDYLDTSITQPTVLTSGWCNTIYHDSIYWAEHDEVPSHKSARKNNIEKREWQREIPEEENVQMGEWE